VRTRRFKYIRNFHPDRPYSQFNAYKKLQYPTMTLMEVLHARGELGPQQAAFWAPVRPVEELYDLEGDRFELHNLASDPQHREELLRLREQLDRWIFETRDQGQIPEDPAIAAFWKTNAEDYYARGMERRGMAPEVAPEDFLQWWETTLAK
jgi:uncharacterized sulfatase